MMINEVFLERMKRILGDEFDDFYETFLYHTSLTNINNLRPTPKSIYLSGRYVLEEAISYSRCPMTRLEKSGHPLPSLLYPGKKASASNETM
jgi:hypothetical protein